MLIEIKNPDLEKGLQAIAEQENRDINEVATELLSFSLDNAIATLAMRRIEYALVNEIIPSIKNIEVNTYAARHQITNVHADILENPDRAIAINSEATDLATKIVFEENSDE